MKPFSNATLPALVLVALSASALAAASRKQRRLDRNQAKLRKIFDEMPDSQLRTVNPGFDECTDQYAKRHARLTAAVKKLSQRKFNKRKVTRMFTGWGNYCRCIVENAHDLSSKTESACWKRRFRKRRTKRLLKSARRGWNRVSKKRRSEARRSKRKHFLNKWSSDRTLAIDLSELDSTAVRASIIDIPGFFPDNINFFDAATCRASRRLAFFEGVACNALGAAAFVGVQVAAISLGIVDLTETEPSVPVPEIIRDQMGCAFGPELDDVRMTFNAQEPISVIIDAILELVNPDREPSPPNTSDQFGATAFGNKIRFGDSMKALLSRPSGRALIRHELYHVLQWKNQAGNANLQTSFGRLLATSLMGFAWAREFCLADFKYPCNAGECDGYYCQSINLCSSPAAGSQVLNQACAETNFDAPSVDPLAF